MTFNFPPVRHLYNNTFQLNGNALSCRPILAAKIEEFRRRHRCEFLVGIGLIIFEQKKAAMEFKLRFCNNNET